MTQQELSKAKNPDLPASLVAMQRAAALARQTAMLTNTAIVVVRDGKLARIPATQLREEAAKLDATIEANLKALGYGDRENRANE